MTTETNAVAAVKVQKTTAEKLADAKAYVAKLEQRLLTESLLNNVFEGDRVTIKFGRGDKVRNIDGKIVGVLDTESGKVVAVLGDDFGTYKVAVRDILSNPTAAERDSAPAVEEAPVTAEEIVAAEAAAAGADPLEQA